MAYIFIIIIVIIIIIKMDYKIQYIHENHNDLHVDNAKYFQRYNQYVQRELSLNVHSFFHVYVYIYVFNCIDKGHLHCLWVELGFKKVRVIIIIIVVKL